MPTAVLLQLVAAGKPVPKSAANLAIRLQAMRITLIQVSRTPTLPQPAPLISIPPSTTLPALTLTVQSALELAPRLPRAPCV